ncbi:four-helix bundle copper-binding protein [Piscinibacter gummiphilus]|uniref:Ferredoxin n=1 Tax=Piscinibacter gummiphilus TaxID=946333 RepID=A0A1W6LGL9_9BURK|nr:four-helix bundle copper-binding protein [Piscinibacter gummiphilus]ARN23421.1 ferredoxin [Piscinibacter gummiphilus]ATU68131.1 four-helix bundle copper-binding protein [Piscinibacter gummiphilus]GLS97441.1 hypothetical protein GCM10007918_47330 [Piscinibacter gummiphilus]
MSRETHQACLEACNACATACHHCAAACLGESDVKMMAGCIALDMDCAALCQTVAGFLARGSESAPALCVVCARVCEACGQECGRHAADHCQRCAEACRRCAEACRQMAT